MRILYKLVATIEETEKEIASISAYSVEGLLEQMHKVDSAVEAEEEANLDHATENGPPQKQQEF